VTTLSRAAQAGFNRLSDIAVVLTKINSPSASSSCVRTMMDVWTTDPLMEAASLIFPTGTLGYTIGGFTLTGSSPAKIVVQMVQNIFLSKFFSMICGTFYKGIGYALAAINFLQNGAIEIGRALQARMPGLAAFAQLIFAGEYSTEVEFPGGVTGTISITRN
jgi:hypothetical protein